MPDAALWVAGYLAIGAAVGFFAGMLGIGGGALMIPLLVWLFEAQGLPREHLLLCIAYADDGRTVSLHPRGERARELAAGLT